MTEVLREWQVERYLAERVKEYGGASWKWVSPSNRGVPDRIVILPHYRCPVFVEVKAPGRMPTRLQAFTHERLRELGQRVEVLDSPAAVDLLLAELTRTPKER